jgi:hypothetical protein
LVKERPAVGEIALYRRRSPGPRHRLGDRIGRGQDLIVPFIAAFPQSIGDGPHPRLDPQSLVQRTGDFGAYGARYLDSDRVQGAIALDRRSLDSLDSRSMCSMFFGQDGLNCSKLVLHRNNPVVYLASIRSIAGIVTLAPVRDPLAGSFSITQIECVELGAEPLGFVDNGFTAADRITCCVGRLLRGLETSNGLP